ncbi:MAG: hypothetical protein ACYST6_20485 [Planctomycetota bacterium]|jgi:hypothetical protein
MTRQRLKSVSEPGPHEDEDQARKEDEEERAYPRMMEKSEGR